MWRHLGRVQFEWDEAKSRRNAGERGLPFDVAMALFDGPRLVQPDRRRDYGEDRLKVIGRVRDAILVCVYTDRVLGGRLIRRIISLRAASRKERDAYRAAFPQ